MIDIHTHILPGVDDGAETLEDSLRLARAAVEDGIHTVIATPHHANGKYTNSAADILPRVRALNEELIRADIPLTVLPGQEIRLTNQFFEEWESGTLQGLHESSYILIEFPSGHIPLDTPAFIYELSLLNLQAIIAHPERNAEIASKPDLLQELIEKGALAQVTSHSLNGSFGSKIQQVALQLCRRNLVHFVSTDAHHWEGRGFDLSRAYALVERELGAGESNYYKSNAACILANSPIPIREPLGLRKKWYQFW
ncbi:tyrosine-protein phosphatase [Paenibacillus sp. HJGM_3]|uniref:tyrosine-protein phosphatase n=1 Tax=Paenibacillus sp. HJGM_3 TaxID=3379816 RepID=UPI00386C947E